MTYQHQEFPAWRYGPNGAAVVVNSEDETPKGFSAKRDKTNADAGAHTSIASPNGPKATPEKAAKTTDAVSRASTDIAKAAKAGVGGAGERAPNAGNQDPAGKTDATELDADGHPYDANLHAGTGSKTKAGLWRMKVGVARPAPVPGYPKPAAPLDL